MTWLRTAEEYADRSLKSISIHSEVIYHALRCAYLLYDFVLVASINRGLCGLEEALLSHCEKSLVEDRTVLTTTRCWYQPLELLVHDSIAMLPLLFPFLFSWWCMAVQGSIWRILHFHDVMWVQFSLRYAFDCYMKSWDVGVCFADHHRFGAQW